MTSGDGIENYEEACVGFDAPPCLCEPQDTHGATGEEENR